MISFHENTPPVLYNSKRPHKSPELLKPAEYILRENKNCNMWWNVLYKTG
ncbi:hypothetical protein GW090_25010 [Escherichia coli]|nr:hypothetical protein [Escherichia coli]